jgi:DmsE family decaheme c-type cytochrome
MSTRTLAFAVFASLTLLTTATLARGEGAPTAPAFAAKAELTCMKCHDSAPVTDILGTPHAVKGDDRTPFGDHGCENCHGASPEHIRSANHVSKGEQPVVTAVSFTGPHAAPVETRNAICLNCHEGNARINWQQGKHANNDIACTNCHSMHVRKDPVLAKLTQPDKCFTCHAQQRADSFQFSHHPVREGKVACADCHSVHGSPSAAPGLLKEFTLNETCYNCHADKRGPMLFEHQPVRENCDYCHTPHGSSQARLLTDRMPYSCISCHSTDVAGGHSITNANARGNSTAFLGGASVLGNARITSNAAPIIYMQARSCLNCHSAIHGSNSPNGFYFFR